MYNCTVQCTLCTALWPDTINQWCIIVEIENDNAKRRTSSNFIRFWEVPMFLKFNLICHIVTFSQE